MSTFPPSARRAGAPRVLALALALALVVAACGGGGGDAQSGNGRPSGPSAAQPPYSLVQAQSALPVGSGRFVFGLVGRDGKTRQGGSPQLWVSRDGRTLEGGPFPARWVTWSPHRGDPHGASPIPGFYVADVTIPEAGNWLILARDTADGPFIASPAAMPVSADVPAKIGERALSVPTPVADTPEEAAKIDTREPPAPMHYISLDAALTSGKPTVLVFATPLLCPSRMCGPVVDEVLYVYDRVGRERANFVDVEIYPERNTQKRAPAFDAWGFQSEPWVLVIDRTGVIRGRFEGPVVASEIEAALQPLLA